MKSPLELAQHTWLTVLIVGDNWQNTRSGIAPVIESEVLNVWPASGGNGGRRRQHTNNFAQRNAQRLLLQLSTSISEPVKWGMDEDCILSARLLRVALGLLNFPGNCSLSAFYIWTQEESEVLQSSSWHHARGKTGSEDRTEVLDRGSSAALGRSFSRKQVSRQGAESRITAQDAGSWGA